MTLKSLVPMARVRSVEGSLEFYRKLGFVERGRHTPEGGSAPVWAWLTCDGAQLMLAQAVDPIVPENKAVLFYLYSTEVLAYREKLVDAGVSAGPVRRPFYAPGGEFEIIDPDGYVLMVTHT